MLCLCLGNDKGTFDEYYIFLYLQKEYQWNEHLKYDISESKAVMSVGCMQRPLMIPAGYE